MAGIHHAPQWRGGMATRGERGAGGYASDWNSRQWAGLDLGTTPGGRPFQQGLKEGGFVEDQNVALEFRWANNEYDRLPELAADLVRQRVSVVVAIGNNLPARAAKAATSTIPIVFVNGVDPVQFGLVASIGRPGANTPGSRCSPPILLKSECKSCTMSFLPPKSLATLLIRTIVLPILLMAAAPSTSWFAVGEARLNLRPFGR